MKGHKKCWAKFSILKILNFAQAKFSKYKMSQKVLGELGELDSPRRNLVLSVLSLKPGKTENNKENEANKVLLQKITKK